MKTKTKREIMDRRFSACGFGQIQDALNILSLLSPNNLTIPDFRGWVEYKKLDGTYNTPSHVSDSSYYICSDCGQQVYLIEVNSMPCNMVGGGYKSMFSCKDVVGCGYTRYSDRTVYEWLSLLQKSNTNNASLEMDRKAEGCAGCGGK